MRSSQIANAWPYRGRSRHGSIDQPSTPARQPAEQWSGERLNCDLSTGDQQRNSVTSVAAGHDAPASARLLQPTASERRQPGELLRPDKVTDTTAGG
jgi:hypothetical protein